jgi:hypothetical protein
MYDHHKKFLIDFQIQKMSPRAAHVSMSGRQGVRHGVIQESKRSSTAAVVLYLQHLLGCRVLKYFVNLFEQESTDHTTISKYVCCIS